LQSEFDVTLYITPEGGQQGHHARGGALGGGRGGRGPSNHQQTLSIHTTKVSQRKSDEKGEMFVNVPGTRPLGALGLDVRRRSAHKGAHGDARVPRLQVEEATRAALLKCVSLLLCVNARERRTYDDGGGGRTLVVVAAAAAAEAGEEGTESGRERHFLCRLEKRKKEGEEKVGL
jgi:hypothetical protein